MSGVEDMDNDDSDSDVEISRKRKLNVLENEDSDETDDGDDDDEDSESDEGEDSDDSEDNDIDNLGDDVNLTDNVNDEQCSICLMEFGDQKVGVPNNCTHVFCLDCIQEWAKNINTCPVDRKVFYTIAARKAKNGEAIEEIKVKDRTQIKVEYEDPTTCEICGVGDREDRMLLCDGCDRGFHLECLTPPLDSVPEEEWFCRDCFVDNAQIDSIDYSQHAIDFSDEETPHVESQLGPTVSSRFRLSSNSEASTSQQRRARTVATSRPQRRRRRRRRQGARQSGQRAKKKKSTKTTKSSSCQDASTSNTHASKQKKRKRRRSRKSQKKNKKRRKIESDSNTSIQSGTRYLLPHEMEPTATFSLFGSDYDLQCLPVIEPAPSNVVTSTQSTTSNARFSTASNADVLSSIFTGLDTLHSDSLSVDKEGRLRIEENKSESQSVAKSKLLTTATQSTSTSNKDRKPNSSLTNDVPSCSREMLGRCVIDGIFDKQSNDASMKKCKENKSSRQFINEMRIKRLDKSASVSTVTGPKLECTPLVKPKSLLPNSDPGKLDKVRSKNAILTTSSFSTGDMSKTQPTVRQPSLNSYKIPKVKSISVSSLASSSTSQSKETLKFDVNHTQSRIVNKKFKVPDAPKHNTGILHLLQPKVRMKEGGVRGHKNRDGLKKPCVSMKQTMVDGHTDKKLLKKMPISVGQSDTYTRKERSNKPSMAKSSSYSNDANINYSKTSQDLTGISWSDSARPVAVVHPTKVEENNSREIANDSELAAERRRKGIEKLQRKNAICEEVKEALKPFYKYREITKENYKYIYGRAVEKINQSSLPLVSRNVASLVRNYVKKLKGRQIQSQT